MEHDITCNGCGKEHTVEADVDEGFTYVCEENGLTYWYFEGDVVGGPSKHDTGEELNQTEFKKPDWAK